MQIDTGAANFNQQDNSADLFIDSPEIAKK